MFIYDNIKTPVFDVFLFLSDWEFFVSSNFKTII